MVRVLAALSGCRWRTAGVHGSCVAAMPQEAPACSRAIMSLQRGFGRVMSFRVPFLSVLFGLQGPFDTALLYTS